MENSKNSSLSKLIPVMLCFFAMGFVDLVGIASNCKGRPRSVGLAGEYLPFTGILLVPDFLRTNRHVDEPHRSEENRIA